MSKTVKRIIAVIVSAAVICGAVLAALYFVKKSAPPVNVYLASDVSMTDYWGDASESYGMVTADKLQDVYISDTQTVKEIYVTEGQSVKAGDKLLSYDTTLSDIDLLRKNIDVQKLELQLKNAKAELKVINTYTPYTPPVVTPTPTPEPETPLTPPVLTGGTGTLEDPYIWMWDPAAEFDDAFIDTVMAGADTAYAVFEVREGNLPSGTVSTSWNMLFTKDILGNVTFSMFDWVEPPADDTDDTDDGTGGDTAPQYTAAEIAQMKSDKQKEIRDLDLSLRMAEVEYERLVREVSDGSVVATTDGVVTSLTDEETAKASAMPIMRVSGGGGYYITATLSELELETVTVGQTVTVTSWESGMQYEGEITEISNYPSTGGYYSGSGNTNVSVYPFTVFVDSSASFRDSESVSIVYSAAQSSSGFYIQTPFVLTENGKSYVYVANADGLLEKREITTGKNLWGSNLQVLGGLSLEEYVAFPYGKYVKEGAKTVQSTLEDLYKYY